MIPPPPEQLLQEARTFCYDLAYSDSPLDKQNARALITQLCDALQQLIRQRDRIPRHVRILDR